MRKIFILLFFVGSIVSAQNDSITTLDEVVLSDNKLHENSEGFDIKILKDSIILRSGRSLTDLLRFNSNIYLKENGNAMVSSAAFRGTGAAQTAVIWNGININSAINGQTDFSSIYTGSYDNITIRSGGGSVLYGSGAIGGSIHLNNKFRFLNHFRNEVQLGFGSYNSIESQIRSSYGTEKFNLQLGAGLVKSDNDYPYLGSSKRNSNGSFDNLNLNLNIGGFLNSENVIKFYHNSFFGDRNFSGGLYFEAKDRYEAENSRSLLEWQFKKGKLRSTVKLAQVFEFYRYFLNHGSSDFSFGKTNRFLGQYEFRYKISNDIDVDVLTEYSSTNGTGSNVESVQRNVFAGVLIYSQRIGERLDLSLQMRQELANDYESPLLFSLDGNFSVSKKYGLRFNVSRNYRMPSFNDLYWETGGNENLKPETSWQAEIGQSYNFKDFFFSLNGFWINSRDLIKWVPNGNLWYPENVSEVIIYGFESSGSFEKRIAAGKLSADVNYSYTISKNAETRKLLMYVPINKITGSLAYSYKRFGGFYQAIFTDEVYTTTDESMKLDSYLVSHIGFSYRIFQNKKINSEVMLKMNNAFNENYQITEGRPMPPRNFLIQLNLNF